MIQAGSAKRPAFLVYQGLWRFLDYIYPLLCRGCGKIGVRYCPECQSQAMVVQEPLCSLCGEPFVAGSRQRICRRFQQDAPPYVALRSYALFEGAMRDILHTLKYRRAIRMGELLARLLAGFLKQLNWSIGLIIPVPLSHDQLRERGYNQVEFITYPLSLAAGIHLSTKTLRRVRETATQVHLSVDERRENVRGAFQRESKSVNGKRILVVDDVATTGATISACAEGLLAGGADQVYGLTVAKATHMASSHQS